MQSPISTCLTGKRQADRSKDIPEKLARDTALRNTRLSGVTVHSNSEAVLHKAEMTGGEAGVPHLVKRPCNGDRHDEGGMFTNCPK